MKINFTRWTFFLIMFTIVLASCKKEKIDVRDVPFDELTSSYYVLAEGTIEIPIDRMDEIVISFEDNSLLLNDTELTRDLVVGNILITQMTLSTEKFLLRRVESIERSGDQISVKTSDPRLVEALSEYYFNSNFDNIYSFKESGPSLGSIDPGEVSNLFSIFNEEPSSPFELSPIFNFEGEVSFEAIHPHTAYKYFACNNDPSCFNTIDKTDSNPANGYYDVVDAFFDNNLSLDETKNGFFTISIDRFGIDEIGIEYGTKTETGSPVSFSTNETPTQIKDKIVMTLKKESKEEEDEVLDLKYVSTPLTFWGVFTVTIPMCPVMDFDLSAAAYAKIAMVFPSRVNIKMGHVNWNSTIPSAIPDFEFTNNGQPASIFSLFDNGSVVGTAAVNGEAKLRFGVGLGAAISVGEANKFGVSFGAMIEAVNYYQLSGEVGLRFSDILNTQGGGSFVPFGELCMDMGIEYDFFLFTDANLGPFVGDFFDNKLEIPKDKFGLSNFSLMSLLPNYKEDKGLCLGTEGCDGTQADVLNFGLTAEEDLKMEFTISNSQLNNEKYNILIISTAGDTLLYGPYDYGESYELDLSIEEKGKILQDILDGTIAIDIQDIVSKCSANFKSSDIGFAVNCSGSLYENNEFGLGHSDTDIAENTITYYERSQAEKVCETLITTLMSPQEMMDVLTDRPCVNPTGFLLNKTNADDKINSNKAYIWIPVQENGDDILAIEFEFKAGASNVRKFNTEKASVSVLAATICAN